MSPAIIRDIDIPSICKKSNNNLLQTPAMDTDISVQLALYHGFILRSYPEKNQYRLVHDVTNPSKLHREDIRIPKTMTRDEFQRLAFERIEPAFGIDIKKYSKEFGGPGIPWQLNCTVDVDGENQEHLLTNMNIPNEGTWEAAKCLMGLAKGEAKLKVCFAVDKGSFLDRVVLKMFM